MRYNIANSVEQYSKKHSHNKLWLKVVGVLGSIVVFCTTYALILPAITLENEAYCGIEEHLHDDSCYRQITTETVLACEAIAPHEHTDECFSEDGVISCGYADFLIHTHNDDCYNSLGELVCPLEEHDFHIHDENCLSEVISSIIDDEVSDEIFEITEISEITEIDETDETDEIEADTADKVLICTLDENEGHEHTDECLEYESVLTCEIDEAESHSHDEACSVEVVDYSNLICTELETEAITHEHTEKCYAEVLDIDNPVCGLEEDAEHTHDDTCYGKIVDYDTLLCDIEPVEGHAHDDSCYGVCDEMLCTLEESQGHVHGDECYELIPTGNYICGLEEAELHVHDESCFEAVVEDEQEKEPEESEEVPEEPSLPKYTCGMIEVSRLHVHNDALCYDEEGNLICGLIEVYEHIHDYTCFVESEITDFKLTCDFAENLSETEETEETEEIGETVEETENLEEAHEHSKLCYGEWELICTTEEHMHTEECFVDPNPEATSGLYIFSDDNVYVEVQLPEDTTVPKDAQLVVTPLSDENESYADYVAQAEEKFGGEIANIALYDISFYTAEGEYIPVGETANISMAFVECPVDKEANVGIIHFDDEADEPILIDDFRIVEEKIEMFVEKAKEISEDVIEEIQDIGDAQIMQSGFSIQSVVDAVVAFVKPDDVETTEIDENETVSEVRTVVEFTTDGFSVFAVVQIDYRKEYGTYILKDVEADNLNGMTFVISTSTAITNKADKTNYHRALTSDIVSFEPNTNVNLDNMHLAAGNVDNNGDIVTVKSSSIEKYLWKFEKVANKGNVYYIQSVATGEYLHIGQNDANAHTSPNIKSEITVTVNADKTVVLQDGNNRKLAYDNDSAKSIFTAYITPNERGNFVLSSLGVATNGLEVGANLNGVTAVISIRDALKDGNDEKYYAISSDANSYKDDKNNDVPAVKAEQVQRVGNTVYITPDNNKLLWTFHLVDGKTDTYTIESVEEKGQYLCRSISYNNNGLEVRETNNPTEFTLDTTSGNGDLVLWNRNENGVNRYISIATDQYAFTTFGTPNDTTNNDYQRADLFISQYGETIVNFPEDGDIQPVVDLDNRYYMIIAVDNDGDQNGSVALTNGVDKNNATSEVKLPNSEIKALDGQYVSGFIPDKENNSRNFTYYYNLTWFFEADLESPGSYYIRAYNGQEGKWVGYLDAGDVNNSELNNLTIGDKGQSFEVMQAINNDNGDAVVLRRRESEVYVYLYGNNCVNDEVANKTDDNYFIGRNAGEGTAGRAERGNHVVLAGFQNVNKILEAAEYLLDNLDVVNGKFVFTDDAYIGSALPKNSNGVPKDNNHGQQGNGGANHEPDFVVGYDQAQAYRREMQQLARLIRDAVDKQKVTYDGKDITLTDDEIKYVKSAIEVIANSKLKDATYDDVFGDNGKLKWLWDVVKTVESNDPIGVKVNLFNYGREDDPLMNSTDSGISEALLMEERDKDGNVVIKGFSFYHKIQYDSYTAIVDSSRYNSGNMGCNDSALTMYPTLYNGSPSVKWGAGLAENTTISENDGSLGYLFDNDSKYKVASMDNGGGLFQIDDQGYYYYYCNQNAAYYDKPKNKFVLYDTVVRPMYIHRADPGSVNDLYNFIPFNSPYDDLIFDDEKLRSNSDEIEDVTNKANTERSGYINERADMWFGMTIEFDFYMPLDGKVTYNGETQNMVFEFYGDDDVWVYIDDQLVLDIGGVHGAEKGTINFATGDVYYHDGSRGTGEVADVNIKLSDIVGLDTDGKTLVGNTKHTLKFFYMERGGNVSYCGLRFNMPTLLPDSLTVSKELGYQKTEGTEDKNNPVEDYIADSLEYQFRVVKAKEVGDKYEPTNDIFLIEGTEYSILDKNGAVIGKGTVGENGIFTLKPGQSALFKNIPKLAADVGIYHYFVQEIVSDEVKGQYEGVTYVVSDIHNGKIENEKTEKIENFDGYTSKEIGTDGSHTVTFKNILKPIRSTLEITKSAKDGSTFEKGQTFKFRVKFGDQLLPKGTKYIIKGKDEETGKEAESLENGIIELQIGQTAVFDGLIAGMKYEVSELIGAGDEFDVIYSGETHGIIGVGNKVEITATNYTGTTSVDIPIEKKVRGGSENATFKFRVETGTYDDAKVWNPSITRDLLQGVSVDVNGESGEGKLSILYNEKGKYYYCITEEEVDGYVIDKSVYIVKVTVSESNSTDANGKKQLVAEVTGIWKDGEAQKIPEDSEISLSFTNTRLIPITIDKNVIGTSTDESFKFTVKIGDEEREITLKHGESTTIMVPWGAEVEVVETATGNYIPYWAFAKDESEGRYEAEKSEQNGTNEVAGDPTLNGGVEGETYVGNIGGGTKGTCTFDVKVSKPGHYLVYFRYGTWSDRSFGVTVNGGTQQELKCPASGEWYKFTLSTPIVVELKGNNESNTIVVGGFNNGEAPNLDYILVVPTNQSEKATVDKVEGPTNISFVNQVTYRLPETGGVGTYRYTFGGVALILGATFLMYKSQKRKKKGGA